MVLLLLIAAQIGWGVCGSAQTPPASGGRPLTLIPTAFQELNELRLNTGEKAVLSDGTYSAVYDKRIPAEGNTYLNFHVDVATETGPIVLRAGEIRLVKDAEAGGAVPLPGEVVKGKMDPATSETSGYIPFDWFIDTGDEVRGDSLTVADKAIVQFTIEVPREGRDDLTLFLLSQRIGTVREIREQIANDRGID
jgi:hypothetical protein